MKWKVFSAVLTVITILAGTWFQKRHERALNVAHAAAQLAQREARNAILGMDVALAHASAADQRAVQAEQAASDADARARQIAARRVPVPALPDTCAPVLEALAQADSAAAAWQEAYEHERRAAGELRASLDSVALAGHELADAAGALDTATTALGKASRPSFLARLKPNIGIGGAVGIDPTTGQPAKVVGVTFSWRVW